MIYFLVRDQYIIAPGGVVALNQMAIHAAMELYEIDERTSCFEKVLKLYNYFIKKDRESAEGTKRI